MADNLLRHENQENMQPRKPGGVQHVPPKGRTVLGVLQGNQRARVQPKVTKSIGLQPSQVLSVHNHLGINDENYGNVPAGKVQNKQPSFAIHVDEPDCANRKKPVTRKADLGESLCPLNSVVMSLGTRQPLAPLQLSMETSFDSPMDMSIVDEEKSTGPKAFPDYTTEIHTYLREMEVKCKPKSGYMLKQPDITNNMRAILVDWLVEVGEEYKLQNETLYLAVNYIDRFLSSMSVLRGKLQLVGTAAMLLASKFEEIYPPEVAEFVYITDDTYTKKQVLKMEHLVLKVLSFDLAAPTILQYLNHYFQSHPVSQKTESLCMYLGELSLIDSDPFLRYLPSVIAASAFVIANYTINYETWPESLVELTSYTLESLKPCILDLYKSYVSAANHQQQAVREKYKHSKYHGVSVMDPPETLSIFL
ncbi:cyclin-A2 [Spea bombifrons]|uniref:cyclin-A2 n=1 Tax=Spea bombifrons TaxID=233779 RepID=UPI00234A95E6|nr:cyclin-A2 [Spea bombifrons]